MISDAEDLERDVVSFMQSYTADGGYFDATWIGLNVGFDRPVAARNVRSTLTKLLKRGIIEQDKTEKPIIYRIKPTTQSDIEEPDILGNTPELTKEHEKRVQEIINRKPEQKDETP